MLKITIVTNDISASVIRYNEGYVRSVSSLPKKLCKRVTEALDEFKKANPRLFARPLEIQYSPSRPYIFMGSTNYRLSGVYDETLVETIKLLHWYMSPHIFTSSTNGVLGSKITCLDCGTEQMMYDASKCQSRACPSHKKWEEIIESYVPPDIFHRAWLGIPRSGTIGGCPKS
ncbi:MAG: hypothetical protein A2747_01040 [Candidatus Yonathbacteria bacterium RIFCSPHIGHO2_01_FULL_44_41]|uniref:Uncharacterized protein n=1 Tax=Candidatus Yonathbacteria bacterium RIFCSPHIGHO2_02_FULL_44_14 TaxID=1802724 RepID=A0A1G2S8M5_9BACT|nr:MAG: hypothetical protein A2747_01040 [Candidatus Yonathbacteria bacterium RIFCSPHIGHO2_01_FULL_44_41]OHA81460.1 MAG: hypothetical protein A3D51_00940 [Candidatus Yonathbacteria bacterium RIFCSPHIGHO2_02_FULL_44_14]OHA81980.1 MAG: hypothetical protein A3B06_03985 [Candidatus Yonathbacteria bacterium RIFCSPLOWO2_01_FULL_43_20]